MLDIRRLRATPDQVKEAVVRKGADPALVDTALQLDAQHRDLTRHLQALHEERKAAVPHSAEGHERAQHLKAELKRLQAEDDRVYRQLQEALQQIPNLPLPQVPIGMGEKDNVVIRSWGQPPHFDFPPRDHLDLGQRLKIIDFEAGAKVTGSQFYFLCNEGALLELALMHFAFHLLIEEGFTPVITPDLAKARYYLGTGYAPKGDEAQTYTIADQDLGLIATAEVTLAGKHADEIIPEAELPLKYIGYSHAFRQEAGAYGRYSRGLYRVHQFSKAEMFVYCVPEDSDRLHAHLLALEERIYQSLEIPYRVAEACTGDLGAMAARKYDIEAWMPGRNDYGEVTSTSNCTDYQARNLNIRFRRKNGEVDYPHMLNGTAIATSRTPIAILENYQRADGSVAIPEVLRPYIGKSEIHPR
jgi:seryl-tRNA synthetase